MPYPVFHPSSCFVYLYFIVSLALNFDDYLDDWTKLGISLPSEMKDSNIYSVAAEQSKHEKHRLYSSSGTKK